VTAQGRTVVGGSLIRRALVRRAVLALLGIAAIAAGLVGNRILNEIPRSPALLLADLAVGWTMIGAGLILADRRPGHGVAILAILTGFAWFLGDVASSTSFVTAYWGNLVYGWFDPLFAILILAYPTGRLVGRVDRGLALGFVAVQAGWTLTKALTLWPYQWASCPTCADTVDGYVAGQELAQLLGRVETLLLSALTIGLLVVVLTRWARASGPARRRLAPVAAAGVVLAIGFFGAFIAQTIVPTSARTPVGELRVVITAILRILVAVALLMGILRESGARGRIADLMVGLDSLPSTAALQASLRDALGDPSLELLRWDPDRGGYVASDGTLASVDATAPGRTTLAIGGDGKPLLAIAHDPALDDDPGLVPAAATAVKLAVENERLAAEVRAQLEAVRASRARIVEAEDTERRRIERDLHDGAQQRLVALQIALQLLRRRVAADADDATLAEIDASVSETQLAIDEIRELARGLRPAILTESGLGPALEALARRSRIPVVVDARIEERLPAAVEATAYFVVTEALTNAARHADATRVRVTGSVDGSLLLLDIEDDGRGGAVPGGGTGLIGLEDRVAALGGRFAVDSPPGAGTRIHVELPCASS
jgi:signal transduction histidine kinase